MQVEDQSSTPLAAALRCYVCRITKGRCCHAPHSASKTDSHADHRRRSGAGQARRGAIVNGRAGAFHGAAARLRLDQPASKPRLKAQRKVRPTEKKGASAINPKIAG